MTSTYTSSSTQLQQAQLWIAELLQQQDYFNAAKIDQIQLLIAGHTDYFEAKIWQEQLKQQEKIHVFFTDFLNFYLNNFQRILDEYNEQLETESKKTDEILAQTSQRFDAEKMINQDEDLTIIYELASESKVEKMQSLEKMMLIDHWLRVFTPFAEHNIPLVWQAFKHFPRETFPLVCNISVSHLEPQQIEIFYQLFAEDKLNHLLISEQSLTSYIQHFYDQFPELLARVPQLFEQTPSSQLKVKLLSCLSDRQSQLPIELQKFILAQFIQSEQQGRKETVFATLLYALAKCQTVEISDDVMQKLKQLLNDDVWYIPMLAREVLNALGVREAWFKQHLLDALDMPYGGDYQTPQQQSIEILIGWKDDGLYAKEKITQLLQQNIQQNDQRQIRKLTIYIDAYPQLATHFQPLLWQWIEDLSQKLQNDAWIIRKTLMTFLQLSAWCNWQPHTQQWQTLEIVLHRYLESLSEADREKCFELLVQHLQLNLETIKDLKKWCVDKDAENQSLMNSQNE